MTLSPIDAATTSTRASEPVTANEASLGQVQQLAKLITETLQGQGTQPRFSLLGPNHETLPVPRDVLTLLQQLLAVLASGGLSHFFVDEELDRHVLDLLAKKDGEALGALPGVRLESGNSENSNRIATAGATGNRYW